jgi:nucleoid DNA-binding protein
MQNVNLHLSYLLTKHECVIIPGFGAFVVSPVQTDQVNKWGIMYPPANFLGFNSELKHNDGLLTNSIAKGENISYNEAVHLIRRYVDDLHNSLNEKKIIRLPWLGNLQLSEENKILFSPANNLSCNAFNYGFTNFHLSHWSELQKTTEKENHHTKVDSEVIWVPLNRKILTYTGSVAAALLALFLIPTPLNNQPDPISTQSASIFTFPTTKVIEPATFEVKSDIISNTASQTDTAVEEKIETAEIKVSHSRQYFIVVASLPNRKSAEDTLSEFQSKGFKNVGITSSEGKHRIYINRFEDKKEAESFLIGFRKDNPKYSTAWLLGQNV